MLPHRRAPRPKPGSSVRKVPRRAVSRSRQRTGHPKRAPLLPRPTSRPRIPGRSRYRRRRFRHHRRPRRRSRRPRHRRNRQPLYYELPFNVRKDLPALTVSMHVYAAVPAQRFVVVDGERKVEGETIKEGLTLREIRADGIVLEFRGQKFFYPRPGR